MYSLVCYKPMANQTAEVLNAGINPTNVKARFSGPDGQEMRLVDPASGVDRPGIAPGYTAQSMAQFKKLVCAHCPAGGFFKGNKECPGPEPSGLVTLNIYDHDAIRSDVLKVGLCVPPTDSN